MGNFLSILIPSFTLLVIACVHFVMGRKPLTDKEISDYQILLDEADKNAKLNYGLEWNRDAKTELMIQRQQKKCFTLIFSGIFLAFVLIALAIVSTLTNFNISLIALSAILLICYGLIMISESKKFAVSVLSFIFIAGTIAMLIFDHLILISPYAFVYLCVLIVIAGIVSFAYKKREKV